MPPARSYGPREGLFRRRNLALAALAFFFFVAHPSVRTSPSRLLKSRYKRPPKPPQSQAAVAYWAAEVAPDTRIQPVLADLYVERQKRRAEAVAHAQARGLRLNDRTRESDAPVVVYWSEPPYWWKKEYGTGQGEHIQVDNCPVKCTLVSGHSNDTAQRDAHVVMEYNTHRNRIDGLPATGPRSLRPWQKAALYSMEANSVLENHLDLLKLFDIFSHFSAYSDIRFETYIPNMCDDPEDANSHCIGLPDVTSRAVADRWWGKDRTKSPFFDEQLAAQAPLPTGEVRLATFISNCYGSTRNRLIRELVEEGIVFDHYGKCKEDVFGGVPQNYSAKISALVKPDPDSPSQKLRWQAKMKILAMYPFVLILENTILSDYISEKITQGILAGGIPIILGAPNLASEIDPPTAPHPPLYIDAMDYTPSELAAHLRRLAAEPALHAEYRAWTKTLPDAPVVEYARRTSDNNYLENGLMRPICDICQYYHENYDWETQAPVAF